MFARLPDGLKNQAILAENRIKETFERGIRSELAKGSVASKSSLAAGALQGQPKRLSGIK